MSTVSFSFPAPTRRLTLNDRIRRERERNDLPPAARHMQAQEPFAIGYGLEKIGPTT